jgi:predicted RNase H-like nuclease (RuvC/YqgF family)
MASCPEDQDNLRTAIRILRMHEDKLAEMSKTVERLTRDNAALVATVERLNKEYAEEEEQRKARAQLRKRLDTSRRPTLRGSSEGDR